MTVRLSSGTSANILDFRIRQKHVLPVRTAEKAGCGTGPKGVNGAFGYGWPRRDNPGESHGSFFGGFRQCGPKIQSGARERGKHDIRHPPHGEPDLGQGSCRKAGGPRLRPRLHRSHGDRPLQPAKGWHDARIERPRISPRSGARRAALRTGDFRGAEGLQARRWRREPVPSRRQRTALPPFRRPPGDGEASQGGVHGGGRATRRIDRAWIPRGTAASICGRS